jgi:chorismate mutase/prephenate dehydrogenase
VLLKARRDAESLGVSPGLAEALMQSLIRGSLTTQEQARIAWQGRGSGKRALVIGGHGKMGRWFAEFLASQGSPSRSPIPAASSRVSSTSTTGSAATSPRPRRRRDADPDRQHDPRRAGGGRPPGSCSTSGR